MLLVADPTAHGDQVLIKTDVTKYLEFKAVDGSFVLNGPRIEKVPITGMEAFRSPLMGLFEKRRAALFFRRVLARTYGKDSITTATVRLVPPRNPVGHHSKR